MDRSIVSVLSGQTVDFFDQDFRELYAASDQVDLYKEFNITKPPAPAPAVAPRRKVEPLPPLPVSASRFQISVDDTKKIDLKVPAHKYHNPKYSLVFGNSRGFTGSLQDLSTATDSLVGDGPGRNGLLQPEVVERAAPQSPAAAAAEEAAGDDDPSKAALKKNQPAALKKRSSFRHFLKGKAGTQLTETIEEGVATPQSPAPLCGPPEVSNGVLCAELDDTFELLDKPAPLKAAKAKKPAKVISRSLSLQTLNTGDEDGMWHSAGEAPLGV